MSNVSYVFSDDGKTVYGTIPGGITFIIDADALPKIQGISFYYCHKGYANMYMMDSSGRTIHDYLFPHKPGYEIDHINLDTLDNRRCNIRYCTHQQNQINQPLQKNNTSSVTGVSWYSPRKKYRARIKIGHKDIHLGYYNSFTEAVQARNVGMECMFGEFGRYNDVPPAPMWIRKLVVEKCRRFAELSVCRAFLMSENVA